MTPFTPLNWLINFVIAVVLGLLTTGVLLWLVVGIPVALANLFGFLIFLLALGGGWYFYRNR